MKTYDVAVFVERGKRGWKFQAYTRVYNPRWDGCNMVHNVKASSGKVAKQKAIESVKARMDLKSKIAPTDVAVCK